jgi:hypothetical protein
MCSLDSCIIVKRNFLTKIVDLTKTNSSLEEFVLVKQQRIREQDDLIQRMDSFMTRMDAQLRSEIVRLDTRCTCNQAEIGELKAEILELRSDNGLKDLTLAALGKDHVLLQHIQRRKLLYGVREKLCGTNENFFQISSIEKDRLILEHGRDNWNMLFCTVDGNRVAHETGDNTEIARIASAVEAVQEEMVC